MRALVWNCRGLGSPRAVRSLRDLITANKPPVLGLIETKLRAVKWENLRCLLGYNGCFVVNPIGRSGGLALLWKEEAKIKIISYSSSHIDCIWSDSIQFRFTLFYGSPVASNRQYSWELIRELSSRVDLPWCIIGDFNEILHVKETSGRRWSRRKQIEDFRNVVQECGLSEVIYKGSKFTYSNKREGSNEVRCRLDRALVNEGWRNIFKESEVHHLVTTHSDHTPLLIVFNQLKYRRSTLFRFEHMWLRHRDFTNVVTNRWNELKDTPISILQKLRKLSFSLQKWNREVFGHVERQIEQLKDKLKVVRESFRSEDMINKEKELMAEIDEWLTRKEIMWRQRSRVNWLKEGDDNTNYFHKHATQRQKHNFIKRLWTDDNKCAESIEEMQRTGLEYFQKLFKPRDTNCEAIMANLHYVSRKVTDDQNDALMRPFDEDEIKRALFDINPSKAPGVDGYSSMFYQKYWELIKSEFVAECLSFLNDGVVSEDINVTRIILIPKQEGAERLNEFRPISLCSVISKTIAKAIVFRLQPILQTVISQTQSAFVKNRLITDNILIAQEIWHYMRNCKDKKFGYGSLKLDMSKAYDRIDWQFLRLILLRLGFNNAWVSRVMQFVMSVKYELSINGQTSNQFKPGRGLRQGDPLSPYLYILCSEWLTSALMDVTNLNVIKGIRICRGAPLFSHLCFADDCLLFFKGTTMAASHIKSILNTYETISGQLINFNKSELVLSPNISNNLGAEISDIMQVPIADYHKKYLGTQMKRGRGTCELFYGVIEKINKRIENWCAKALSRGGKEVLIKSVLYAVPQFQMSCYKLPDSILKLVSKSVMKYWWGNNGSVKPTHWVKSRIVYKTKEEGGMGFREFSAINLAFLAKQAWRLYVDNESILFKTLKAKYFANCSILEVNRGQNVSYGWKGILMGLEILKSGLIWNTMAGSWQWKFGDFNVKNAYQVAKDFLDRKLHVDETECSDSTGIKKFWCIKWRLLLPRKCKIFAWRAYHNGLPHGLNLSKRSITNDIHCRICGFHIETDKHALVDCWWAKFIWEGLEILKDIDTRRFEGMADLMFYCSSFMSTNLVSLMILTMWFIWHHRNSVWHEGQMQSPVDAIQRIRVLHKEFTTARKSFDLYPFSLEMDWVPPTKKVLKVNCDAARLLENGHGGLATVVRDETGCVLAVRSCFITTSSSVFELEVLAVLEGMSLAGEMKLEEVVFETDCSEVVRMLSFGVLPMSRSSNRLVECCDLLAKNKGWRIRHIRREANMLADYIAKKALHDRWSWRLLDCIPNLSFCKNLVNCHP